MKRLGIDRYSIVGWSYGAAVALVMAAQYPKRVQRLVLHGCFASAPRYNVALFTSMSYKIYYSTWNLDCYSRGASCTGTRTRTVGIRSLCVAYHSIRNLCCIVPEAFADKVMLMK